MIYFNPSEAFLMMNLLFKESDRSRRGSDSGDAG